MLALQRLPPAERVSLFPCGPRASVLWQLRAGWAGRAGVSYLTPGCLQGVAVVGTVHTRLALHLGVARRLRATSRRWGCWSQGGPVWLSGRWLASCPGVGRPLLLRSHQRQPARCQCCQAGRLGSWVGRDAHGAMYVRQWQRPACRLSFPWTCACSWRGLGANPQVQFN